MKFDKTCVISSLYEEMRYKILKKTETDEMCSTFYRRHMINEVCWSIQSLVRSKISKERNIL